MVGVMSLDPSRDDRRGAMCDSRRYRSNASECLLASYEARQPCYGKLNFSMAALWLALAGQDEAIDNLLASWDMARARQN